MRGRWGQFPHRSVTVFPSKDPPCKQMSDPATTLLPYSHIWILSLMPSVRYDTSETVGGGEISQQVIRREGEKERKEGSRVGAPPNGRISSDESALRVPGAAPSCVPLSSPLAQMRRTGGLYCFGSLPVLGTRSGRILMNSARGL